MIPMLGILLAFSMLGCPPSPSPDPDGSAQPAQPNGNGGVSVNAEEALVIDAPLYVVDLSGEIDPHDPPQIVSADSSLNGQIVYAYNEYDYVTPIATGTITNGRLTITIPKPDSSILKSMIDFWDESGYPSSWIQAGANVKMGVFDFETDFGQLVLYANPSVKVYEDSYPGYGTYSYYWANIDGEICGYFYSQGDIAVYGSGSGTDSYGDPYIADFDFKLIQGWNSGMSTHNFNTGKNVLRSQNPPASAKWVLEYDH